MFEGLSGVEESNGNLITGPLCQEQIPTIHSQSSAIMPVQETFINITSTVTTCINIANLFTTCIIIANSLTTCINNTNSATTSQIHSQHAPTTQMQEYEEVGQTVVDEFFGADINGYQTDKRLQDL